MFIDTAVSEIATSVPAINRRKPDVFRGNPSKMQERSAVDNDTITDRYL